MEVPVKELINSAVEEVEKFKKNNENNNNNN